MENFEQKVLFLLVMRYSLDTYRSFSAINDWLSRHPQQSINELYNLLSRGRVILRRGILFALNRREIEALALRMHSEQGVEIQDRWYRLILYRQCFIGSQAVQWLMNNENLKREEAILLGQILIEEKIIHHVLDQHDFKNEFLFYRFYQDE